MHFIIQDSRNCISLSKIHETMLFRIHKILLGFIWIPEIVFYPFYYSRFTNLYYSRFTLFADGVIDYILYYWPSGKTLKEPHNCILFRLGRQTLRKQNYRRLSCEYMGQVSSHVPSCAPLSLLPAHCRAAYGVALCHVVINIRRGSVSSACPLSSILRPFCP